MDLSMISGRTNKYEAQPPEKERGSNNSKDQEQLGI
jgi:hypothetical protein